MLWAQSSIKDYIRAEHKLHSITKLFISQVITPQVIFVVVVVVWAYIYSAGSQHGNLHPASWPILFCRPTQEPVLAAANTGKKHRRAFGKNAGKWTRRVEIAGKKSLAISEACIAIYWLTPGFKGRTFKLCVLITRDFNFCVRSSPLRAERGRGGAYLSLWGKHGGHSCGILIVVVLIGWSCWAIDSSEPSLWPIFLSSGTPTSAKLAKPSRWTVSHLGPLQQSHFVNWMF